MSQSPYGYGAPPPAGGYGYPPPPGYGPGMNPYGPPAVAAWDGQGPMPGAGMKWVYLSGWIGLFVFFGIAGIAGQLADAHAMSGDAPGAIVVVLALAAFASFALVPIGAMVWLYKAWSTVPPAMRFTASGTAVTPGTAVGYCFIPIYNLYWVFVANVGLCEAIDRTFASRGMGPRAPRGLAIAACVGHLVPYCNLLVAPILWTIYMFMTDSARRDMVGALQS